MLIIMCKSRFMKVGTDNTTQFDKAYMAELANLIMISTDPFIKDADQYYIGKERMIKTQGVQLKIFLNEEDFRNLRNREIIKQDDAKQWIKRCVVGNIRKSELDEERLLETNSMDMFCNSSIVYHTESILEMQVLMLCFTYYFNSVWSDTRNYGVSSKKEIDPTLNLTKEGFTKFIMLILFCEHILSYIFGIFRDWEQSKYGKPNKYGITSAKWEFRLKVFEVILDITIFIMILVHFSKMDALHFHDIPFLNYWIVVDMIIMFLTLPYTYVSRLMMITGEIIKNMFTLYQVQKKKLRKRRENMKKNPNSLYKSFFDDNEKEEMKTSKNKDDDAEKPPRKKI